MKKWLTIMITAIVIFASGSSIYIDDAEATSATIIESNLSSSRSVRRSSSHIGNRSSSRMKMRSNSRRTKRSQRSSSKTKQAKQNNQSNHYRSSRYGFGYYVGRAFDMVFSWYFWSRMLKLLIIVLIIALIIYIFKRIFSRF